MVAIERDNAFEMTVAAVRYGAGVTRELGIDLADRSLPRALIITDPVIARLSPARAVVDSLDANDVQWVMYDRVRVEPTEESWLDAIDFARGHTFDAIVAVGGPEGLMPLWWALSLGACLGGNGTLIGASANLTVAGIAERNGIPFRFLRYTKIAFPLMLIHVAIGHVYLLWRYL